MNVKAFVIILVITVLLLFTHNTNPGQSIAFYHPSALLAKPLKNALFNCCHYVSFNSVMLAPQDIPDTIINKIILIFFVVV